MKWLKHISSFLLLFTVVSSSAQEFENYRPLSAKGPIPQDFLTLSSEKFRQDAKELSAERDSEERQAKEDFLVGSNYMVDELLNSGQVLFNDPVSEYLNDVLDQLLQDRPDLQQEIRVYAVKSSVVNAFTTNNGIIFVNLGMLAQLETEAQLAFVLGHEVIHYLNGHVMNVYLEGTRIKQGKGLYQNSNVDQRALARSSYSREIEKEADSLGLQLFLQSGYSTAQLNGVFDALQYTHLPFSNVEFDKSFFETPYFTFPEDHFLPEVTAIVPESDKTNITHPSVDSRRETTMSVIGTLERSGKQEFLVSEERFKKLRKVARFELCQIHYLEDEFEEAIYNSYLLLQDYPDNRYLHKVIARSLYSMVKYSNNLNFRQIHTRYAKVQGESQQLYHLMERMKPAARNVLAINYLWKLKKKFEDDEDIAKMSKDLLRDFIYYHYEKDEYVTKAPEKPDFVLGYGEFLPDDEGDEKDKYHQVKELEKNQPKKMVDERDQYYKGGLADKFADDEFKTVFEALITEKKAEERMPYKEKVEKAKQLRAEKKLRKNHGFALGLDKVVIVTPNYAKVDMRKEHKMKYFKTEEARFNFHEKIRNSADLVGLDYEMLDGAYLDKNSIRQFNDIAYLNGWIEARFKELDYGIEITDAERSQELMERYGTKYFTWTGVLSYREKKKMHGLNIALSTLALPVYPFWFINTVSPRYETYYYNVTFNIETGEPVMTAFSSFKHRDAQDFISANVYDSIYQLKSARED